MHEAFLKDPEIGPADIYFMTGPAEASRIRGDRPPDDPEWSRRVLKWGAIPKTLDRSKILKLCLSQDDSSIVDLPEVVRELPNLLWLQFPGRFLKRLQPGAIPPTVRTLSIWDDENATLPASIHLPGLVMLETVGSNVLRFRAEQIPDVRHLGVKLDPAGKVLEEIERVEKLEALRAGPVSSREVLERLASKPLRFLKPKNGNIDTIEPLRECPTLTNLWLCSLSKLTSLAPLADLPALAELSISYCPRLRLDPSFLTMPSLRKLMMFANRDIGVAAIEPGIRSLGLDHLLISGTR